MYFLGQKMNSLGHCQPTSFEKCRALKKIIKLGFKLYDPSSLYKVSYTTEFYSPDESFYLGCESTNAPF